MKIDGRSELPKIVRILGHDNPIFGDGARKDDTIWLAQPTAVARVNRVMKAQLVEMATKRRRTHSSMKNLKPLCSRGARPGARPADASCRR